MTTSMTTSTTFTITEARYVGAKVGADLRRLNTTYGRPALKNIEDYAEEVALLLKAGYLGTIDYGFKSGDVWKLRLRYTATSGGNLVDNRPGSLPSTFDIAGLDFYSYLTHSAAWDRLSTTQQAAFKKTLPISRDYAAEPTTGLGATDSGHGYSKNGQGVARDVYTAY